MPAGLDMSLDQITTHRRTTSNRPNRHLGVRNSSIRITPYSISLSQMLEREALRRSSVDDVPQEMVLDQPREKPITKLYLSNLDDMVSNEDIHLLFSEEGELESYSIHYDQFGRSKGTAEVVFTRQSEALAALKRYNNMKLDGKTLQIELVGASLVTPAAAPLGQSSLLGKPNDVFARCKIPSPGLMSSGTNLVTPADMSLGRSSLLGKPNDVFARCQIPFPGFMSYGTTADMPLGRSSLPGRPNDVYVREERKFGGSRYNNSSAPTHGYLPRKNDHTLKAKRQIPTVSAKDLDEDLERYRSEAMKENKGKGKGNHD